MRRSTWLLLAAAMLPAPAWALTPAEIAEANKDTVVFLEITGTDANGVPKEGTATGFLVSNTGHVITAKHIVNDDQGRALFDQYEIKGVVGSRYEPLREMEIRARDPDADVLLLQFKGSRTDYQTVCIGEGIDVGADLVAMGFPKGSDRSTIRGVLSNKSGAGGLWQTDTAFSQGYSGAPVFALDGQVVGIVSGGTHGVEGRNFFTPLHDATYLLNRLPEPVKKCGSWPAALEISGRYVATSSDRPGMEVVLNIQPGSEGTFSGTLAFPRGGQFIVEGRAIGDMVTFEAHDPNGYEFVRFEGKFTGGSIRGRSRIISPSQGDTPWELLEFAAGGPSAQSPPTSVPYVDPGPAPQTFPPPQGMSAKLCCIGGLTGGWCESWSSRPGRSYAYEDLTYAELGSACYCAGLTKQGHVDYCP